MTENMPSMAANRNPRQEGTLGAKLMPLERIGSEEDFLSVILFFASRAGANLAGAVVLTGGGCMSLLLSNY